MKTTHKYLIKENGKTVDAFRLLKTAKMMLVDWKNSKQNSTFEIVKSF